MEPSNHKRRLAAIVFTDITDFTEMSSKDEKKAFELISKQRELLKPIVEKYDGEWLKEIGDGLLLTFPIVSGAVEFAISAQKSVKNIPNLNLRIGIHLGEIFEKDNDVYGDGVNIASRIEAFSPVGGISISDSVYKSISSNPKFTTEHIGSPILKGLKNEIDLYIITSNGLPGKNKIVNKGQKIVKKRKFVFINSFFAFTGFIFTLIGAFFWLIYPMLSLSIANESTAYEKSIAILYFDNMGKESDSYFTDGLSEELMNRLSKINNLKVIPSFETKKYKSKDINLDNIYDELEADYLLYGNILKNNNDFNCSVKLIDLIYKKQVWGEIYKKSNDKIFEVQTDITNNIISEFDIKISPIDQNQALSNPTNVLNAYDLLLKAKSENYNIINNYDDLLSMITKIEHIIKQDSSYADALSILATYKSLLFYNFSDKYNTLEEKRNIIDSAIEYANKSLIYDPENEMGLSILPTAYGMKLRVSESTTKKLLVARKMISGLKNLSKYYPDSYITHFAYGNILTIKSQYPIISDNDDTIDAYKYILSSNEMMKNIIKQNINDFRINVLYERSLVLLDRYNRDLSKYDKSKEYILEQIDLINSQNNQNNFQNTKIAKLYNILGDFEYIKGDYISSLNYYLSSYEFSQAVSNIYIQQLSNINIAKIHLQKKEFDITSNLLEEIGNNLNNEELSTISLNDLLYKYNLLLSHFNYMKKDFKKSLNNINQSINILNKLKNNKEYKGKYFLKKYYNQYINFSNIHTKTTLLKNQIILKNNNSYDLILSELIEELKLTDLNQYQALLINYDIAELYKFLNNKIKFKEHTIIAFNIYKYILNSLEEDSSKNLFTNKIMNINLVKNYNELNIPMHN